MILTADEICKAVGARAASERWLKDAQAIESALLEKLRAGVELPEPDGSAEVNKVPHPSGIGYEYDEVDAWSRPLVEQYGDARALAAREQAIEECAQCMEEQDTQAPKYNARAIRALAESPQEQT